MRYIEASLGALQSFAGAAVVNIRRGLLQALLRALFGPLRTSYVNLARTFGSLGKNSDFVGQDFGKSPGDG